MSNKEHENSMAYLRGSDTSMKFFIATEKELAKPIYLLNPLSSDGSFLTNNGRLFIKAYAHKPFIWVETKPANPKESYLPEDVAKKIQRRLEERRRSNGRT